MELNKGTIVYVGAFRFPDKDAAAKRVLGVGYVLREVGFQVVYAGGESGEIGKQTTNGFDYYSQNELDRASVGVVQKITNFFDAGKNTVKWLSEYQKQNKIDKIIVYNSSNVFVSRISKFCKQNNIELIPDITEWYESSHLPGGKYGLVAWDNFLKMKFTYPKFKKLIVISSFLKDHYQKTAERTVIVPPLIFEKPAFAENLNATQATTNILYAGSPGRKDDLYTIVKLIQENPEPFSNLRLQVAGITQEQFEKVNSQQVTAKNIEFKGRISPQEVMELYQNAAFSVIIRPNERYANAGFPTKFVESLSAGVPIIATKTSDLGEFLTTEKNGYLMQNINEKEFYTILENIAKLNPEQIAQLKSNAKETSMKFEFEQYQSKLSEFLN